MMATFAGMTMADFERKQAEIRAKVRTVHVLPKDTQPLPSLRGPRSPKGVNGGMTAEQDKAARLERQRGKRKAARKSGPKVYRESAGEAELTQQLKLAGCVGWTREYRFHGERMWRLDFAWPAAKLGVEIDGGTWTNGRHVRGEGFARDAEKGNAAILLGWSILHYTPEMVKSGLALAQIEQFLQTGMSIAAQDASNPAQAGQGATLADLPPG